MSDDGPTSPGAVQTVDDDPRRDSHRRSVGTAMIVAGVLGLAVATVATVAGWRLVGDVDDTTDESVDVTLDVLRTVEDTIDVSDELIQAVRDSVSTTERSLTSVDDTLRAGSDVIGEVGRLTATVGPALSDVERVLRQLEGVGDTIDGLLGDLSQIPFGPDYDPERDLGDTIGELADTVELLPTQFATTTSDLERFDESVADISTDLGSLRSAITEVRRSLDDSEQLLADYRSNVVDARQIATEGRQDVDGNVAIVRLAVVLGGIAVGLGQIVPLWLGSRLRSGRPI